jgi:hypothetical protein
MMRTGQNDRAAAARVPALSLPTETTLTGRITSGYGQPWRVRMVTFAINSKRSLTTMALDTCALGLLLVLLFLGELQAAHFVRHATYLRHPRCTTGKKTTKTEQVSCNE